MFAKETMTASFDDCRAKMEAEGISQSAISAFESTFDSLISGATGIIPESTIGPVADLTDASSISSKPEPALLDKTVVLKLNGGLGTGMGLAKAKSLLKVKGEYTFLDLTAKQIIKMRQQLGCHVKFMLLNSFSTSEDTLNFLKERYPDLAAEEGLELMQNKVPKLDATSFKPATCNTNPDNEWCPPGHGDLYAALAGSGCLDALLQDGFKYMFVSNSDNLGATLDLAILTHFAQSDAPFMMECCFRTESDKKGGHLAVRKADGRLVLRESAMCAKEDEEDFQDTAKYRYFNTNNLWIRLDKLKEIIDNSGGFIPLPMIKNSKTVDPKDDTSQKVVQLETAMGAAIECFEGATAISVPRTRFAPVKKCNDLLLLRSDAYIITDDFRAEVSHECGGTAPVINLDSKQYKLVEKLDDATALGVPSLVKCRTLTVKGKVRMCDLCIFVGDVSIVNDSDDAKVVPKGTYTDTKLDLTNPTKAAKHTNPLKPVKNTEAAKHTNTPNKPVKNTERRAVVPPATTSQQTKVVLGPPTNKDSRSFRPSSLAEINALQDYRPLVFRYTKRDGTPGECNIGCGNSLEDIVIILSCYITLYCFLLGFFTLLLRGCLDTDIMQTLLWAFFFFGIIFAALVGGAVYVGFMYKNRDIQEKKKKAAEAKKKLEMREK